MADTILQYHAQFGSVKRDGIVEVFTYDKKPRKLGEIGRAHV